jgi:hypothetical protein
VIRLNISLESIGKSRNKRHPPLLPTALPGVCRCGNPVEPDRPGPFNAASLQKNYRKYLEKNQIEVKGK